MQFCLAACTDKGKTRAVNQDALLLQQAVCGRKRYVLAAVCDGLGGLEKGELASSEVLRSLADIILICGMLGAVRTLFKKRHSPADTLHDK